MIMKRLSIADFDDIVKFQRAYKRSVGEAIPTQNGLLCLKLAIEQGRIEFFAVYENDEPVAMCSMARVFSTFRYEEYGVIEDLYVLTNSRKKNIPKTLFAFVQKETGLLLSLTCFDEYAPYFHGLGFTYELGNTYLCIE